MYQLERAAMCCTAGRLTRVRFGAPPDVPTLVTTIVLDFEAGSWALAVNADDDTVRITGTDTTPLTDVCLVDAPTDSPWTRALGSTAQWIWILENQQGYEDGIQFAFAFDGREVCRIQLVAAASRWQTTVADPWDASLMPRSSSMSR